MSKKTVFLILMLALPIVLCSSIIYGNRSDDAYCDSLVAQEISEKISRLDTVTVSLPAVVLEDDLAIQILLADIKPVCDTLAPNQEKNIMVNRSNEKTAYHFRYITPLEMSPFHYTTDSIAITDLIGYYKAGDINLFFNERFKDDIRSISEDTENFTFIVERRFPCTNDPLDNFYFVSNDSVFRVDGSRTNGMLFREKCILRSMKMHKHP